MSSHQPEVVRVPPNYPTTTIYVDESGGVAKQVTAQLLRGAIVRRELVSVLMDSISTPADVVYEDYVRNSVNSYFGCTSVVTAVLLNSKSCDGLQAVDVLAGAVGWETDKH